MISAQSPVVRRTSRVLAATLAGVSSTFAAVQSWNVETGNFLEGTNWSPGFEGIWPVADVAEISNGGTATMASGEAVLAAINIGQNGVGSASGTLIQTGGDLVMTDGIVVGRQGSAVGFYEMTGGTLSLVNLRIGGGSQTSQGTMRVSGANTLVISSGTAHTSIGSPGTGILTLENSAVWTHNGANPFLVGSDNNIANTAGGNGTLHVRSGAHLDIAGTANLTIGRTNGAGGSGTVIVDGGSITIASGLLNMAATNAGPGNAGGVGTLTLNSGSITAPTLNLLEGSSTVNFNGGTATLGGIVKVGSIGSATVNFNGTRVIAQNANGNFITINGSGSGSLALNVQSGGLVLDSNGKDIGIAQAITGTGALTKLGEGMLILSGANSYAGGTIISGGLLIVADGGLLGSAGITVQNGGLLDFDYDFSLTTGGLVLETGSTMVLDQNLTFASVTIEGTSLAEGVYSYTQLASSYGDIFADGGSGQISVVPEPATLVLLALGAGIGISVLRRRKIA